MSISARRIVAGGTSVLVAVHGPRPAGSVKRESPDEATISVTVKPATGQAGPPEKHLQAVLASALRGLVDTAAFPRCVLDVAVHVLGSDGSTLALALVAAGLAVVDAAVPVVGSFSASTVALRHDGEVVLDPTEEDEGVAAAVLTAGICSSASSAPAVLASSLVGVLPAAELPSLLQCAQSAATTAGEFYKLSMRQLVLRSHDGLDTPTASA